MIDIYHPMIESERGGLSHLREDIAVAAQREAMIRGEHRLHVLHLRVQLRDRLRRRQERVVLRTAGRMVIAVQQCWLQTQQKQTRGRQHPAMATLTINTCAWSFCAWSLCAAQ